ncbi:hypothetical protein [Curtobacterium sp. MCBA15_008]|uniref:hypothetical protein n=1 Tax=Curtobacterium sp. MCBA15_008 TaxID=1898736 RepID=UPI0008DD4B9F|nr:hypothetical protein [Curtobacterium sp. MCBA15_008]OII07411.1 hypothetical protein BIU96_18760 [Curtobacterium sp. MCBA15_008]
MAYGNYEFGKDMGAIRADQAASAKSLKSIQVTSGLSMMLNVATAANTARAARSAEEQVAVQREQHALQQAMAAQTARHEFSMWRQTPEGAAFVDWQQRALALVPFLRGRDRSWQAAWARAIDVARAQTPADEQRRLAQLPARLRQTPLKVLSIVSFVLLVLPLIGLGFAALTASFSNGRAAYEECLRNVGEVLTQANCDAIEPENPFTGPIVWLVLLFGLGIVFAVLRVVRMRAARADRRVEEEGATRVARWGFDPLITHGAWYGWHDSENFTGYADRLEQLIVNGATVRPSVAQLIPLQIPTPWQPAEHLPAEVNGALAAMQQEQTSLAADEAPDELTR